MLRLSTFAVILVLVAGSAPAEAQRNCRKGKPCGNTCIARDKVCRIESPGAVGRAASEALRRAPVHVLECEARLPDAASAESRAGVMLRNPRKSCKRSLRDRSAEERYLGALTYDIGQLDQTISRMEYTCA